MTYEQYRLFVIVGEPRTGSNMLVSKICSPGDIICHAEIFHPQKVYVKLPKDAIPAIEHRNANPESFLNTILMLSSIKYSTNIIGFKLFFNHCKKVHDLIFQKKIPVILLERNDKVAQYSSHKIARKTESWTSRQSKKINIDRVNFSILEFISYLIRSISRYSRYKKRLILHNVPYLHISYEDISNNEKIPLIFDFLGVECNINNIDSKYEKQNIRDPFSRFKNKNYALKCVSLLRYLHIYKN